MNKVMLIFAPVVAAGIMFGATSSNFMKSGIPDDLPEIETASDFLPEKAKLLLEKEIVNPVRSKKKNTKAEMYSRCPSGVNYYVKSKSSEGGTLLYTGRVVNQVGCSSDLVCIFRVDYNGEKLEAKSKEEAEFLPVAEWKESMKGSVWTF